MLSAAVCGNVCNQKNNFLPSLVACFQSTPKMKGLSKKEGAKRKINMSGYILFSSEMRAVIKARHPDFSFGELSRLVGTEWRNLEASKKAEYEGEGGLLNYRGLGSLSAQKSQDYVNTHGSSFY